ncbi:hypothetical protein [Sulfurimonas sp.]|uniref:hypothetical protein n=1 Tax=Sulfurimonas sp. TaxID=2022749 RepID=UPI0019EACCFD|nr:hypothetical protein [Sulfurimonas sp.]MBE0513931.1 hypothetical protein [Sulfurimonas sp.]
MAKQTSGAMSSTAAKVMSNKSSSDIQRKLAGSALSQTGNKKVTSEKMETIASKVMQSDKYNSATKGLAASVLSQSTKKSWEK